MVSAGDLSPELDVPVPLERPGDGVEVDHDLHGVAGTVVSGLGVDNDGFVFTVGDDVGLARQSCRPAAEFKPVLSLDVDVVAADFPVTDPLVDEGRVVEQLLGLVDVRWLVVPVLVRFECSYSRFHGGDNNLGFRGRIIFRTFSAAWFTVSSLRVVTKRPRR